MPHPLTVCLVPMAALRNGTSGRGTCRATGMNWPSSRTRIFSRRTGPACEPTMREVYLKHFRPGGDCPIVKSPGLPDVPRPWMKMEYEYPNSGAPWQRSDISLAAKGHGEAKAW